MPSLARCLGHPNQTLTHRAKSMPTNNDRTPSYRRVVMTPSWAKKLLEANTANNRNLKPRLRRRYETAINHGEWRVTHQAIAINEDGSILDGQHRLAAIANTKPVEVMLAENCDASTFGVLDTGAKRSHCDALQAAGVKKNASIFAPAIKMFIQYLYFPKQPWNQGALIPSHKEELLYWGEKSDLVEDFYPQLQDCYNPGKVFSRSVALTFCLIAEEKGWREAEIIEFWNAIGTGANLSADSVLLSFRNQLSSSSYRRRGKNPAQYQLNAAIKCFNDWKEGRTGKFYSPSADSMYTLVRRSDIIKPEREIMTIIPGRR